MMVRPGGGNRAARCASDYFGNHLFLLASMAGASGWSLILMESWLNVSFWLLNVKVYSLSFSSPDWLQVAVAPLTVIFNGEERGGLTVILIEFKNSPRLSVGAKLETFKLIFPVLV